MKVIYKILIILFLFSAITSCKRSSSNYEFNKKQDSIENINKNTVNNTVITDENTAEEGVGFWKTLLVLLISLAIGAGIFYFFYALIPIKLWYQAWLSGIKVPWGVLLKMYFRKIPQDKILRIIIQAKNSGVSLSAKNLANHYLANVNIDIVSNAIIRAHNANLTLDLNEVAALYLARVDVEKVLHSLIMAKNADVETNIQELSGYYLANVDVERIIKSKITARNSGFRIELVDLKEHYLSGGNVEKTVSAFIAAKKAGLLNFDFSDIAEIDLAKYDVTKSVQSCIIPKVVETSGVRGVARDGVELTLKVKVTLRAFIKSIIGGVNEDTVLARVNEGLATEIGMSATHFDVLQSPYILADKVQQKGLESSSAFEILSIDVSDIKVGKDIHSELKIERAHADAEQAKAELIMAEEKVQKAMAAAFLDGRLSIHEYHNMKNTEADTEMRKKLGNSVDKNKSKDSNSHKNEHDEKKDEHH